MKSVQCNIKKEREEARFSRSDNFYRRLCHFRINAWWSKKPLHDIESSSVSQSSHQRTAQCQGAVSWSDIRLYLREKETETEALERLFKQHCSLHHRARFFLTKPLENLQGSGRRARFPLPLPLTSTTYSSSTKAHLPTAMFQNAPSWRPLRWQLERGGGSAASLTPSTDTAFTPSPQTCSAAPFKEKHLSHCFFPSPTSLAADYT